MELLHRVFAIPTPNVGAIFWGDVEQGPAGDDGQRLGHNQERLAGAAYRDGLGNELANVMAAVDPLTTGNLLRVDPGEWRRANARGRGEANSRLLLRDARQEVVTGLERRNLERSIWRAARILVLRNCASRSGHTSRRLKKFAEGIARRTPAAAYSFGARDPVVFKKIKRRSLAATDRFRNSFNAQIRSNLTLASASVGEDEFSPDTLIFDRSFVSAGQCPAA